jgi:tRNA-specific 2-thiouridylase
LEGSASSDIIRNMNRQTRVFVGMSGGVDSSVSAALLKEAGYDVTGVFIKVWQPDWFECTWREDRLDAMRVCVHLGIPFVTLDLEAEYKREVVDYMIAEYRACRTPNPDVMCNRFVKFGGFFDWAMKQAGPGENVMVATGHYARAEGGKLLAGRDQGKDQSYFLWTLSKSQLERTLFPVGDMEKSETRRLARRFGLPVAEKRDSQGLCFIGKVDIREFLGHYIAPRRGDILDEKGAVIGHHDGAVFLTLGERRGFTVTVKSPDDSPYYVVARDIDRNTVTVAHRTAGGAKDGHLDGSLDIERREYSLSSVNWIGGEAGAPQSGKMYAARIRHLGELLECQVETVGGPTSDQAEIGFKRPLLVASGQSVVVCDGDTCIGGGIVM